MGGLAIVVPAYNEERRIAGVAEIISSSEKARGAEIVLVVDGNDRTEEIAKTEFAKRGINLKVVRSAKRLGKGGAVWKGILASDAEIVGFMDADGPVSAEELDGIIKRCEETGNCIIASREIGKRKDSRRVLSAVFNLITRALFALGVSDTQCGCKVFPRKLAGDSPFLISGFAFDVELLKRVMDNGGRIEEYRIEPKTGGAQGTFSAIYVPRMFLDLVRLKMKGARENEPRK
jgi:glycosyltransferase involved in cell wall biosynthesis